VGPWNHIPWAPVVGDIDFGPEARSFVDRAQLTFFEQWLRGGDEPSGSPVLIFVAGANRWEGFEEWPPRGAEFALYLRATSRANSLNGDGFLSQEKPGAENPDVFTYDPAVPVQSLGGRSCCLPSVAPMGPKDQRPVEALNSVLVYTSQPLEADVLTIGSIRAELFAATSAPDTDWTVKVCDVHPNGTSINIQESIQRARFASGTDRARPVSPNDITRFGFEVGACAHLFRRGHRIRVDISSSSFPQWDRNLNTGHPLGSDMLSDRIVATQSVFHDADYPSRVVLSVMEL
jgi:putative CocE/NonD family hydrolase